MTKSRTSPDRLLFGYLGKDVQTAATLKLWNALFHKRGVDASMDRYPCTVAKLPERLSEMMHFDRRGYIVAKSLQQAVGAFMDYLDASTTNRGVDTIVNDGGVFTGYWMNGDDERRWELWLGIMGN